VLLFYLSNILNLVLRAKISKTKTDTPDSDNLITMQVKLQRELTVWRQIQLSRFPALRNELLLDDGHVAPETEPLLLPSTFTKPTRTALGLNDLVDIELELRKGQAHDALAALRIAIKTFNANLQFKVAFVHHQRANTRAQAYLRTLQHEKKDATARYQRAYTALLHLGFSPEDKSLQPLHDNQLWMKDVSKTAQMGDSRKEDPWFWTVGRPSGLTPLEETEWSVESESLSTDLLNHLMRPPVDRVKWFRDRAARDRAREEKEILDEEFRRTVVSFTQMADVWLKLAKDSQRRGFSSYAHEKSDMYCLLASGCQKDWEAAHEAAAVLAKEMSGGDSQDGTFRWLCRLICLWTLQFLQLVRLKCMICRPKVYQA